MGTNVSSTMSHIWANINISPVDPMGHLQYSSIFTSYIILFERILRRAYES